jgi:hypothetical protein
MPITCPNADNLPLFLKLSPRMKSHAKFESKKCMKMNFQKKFAKQGQVIGIRASYRRWESTSHTF